MKIKQIIRLIIFSPIILVISPLLWLFKSGSSYKDIWIELLDATKDEVFLY